MLQNPAHMSSKTARCRERKKAVTRSNPKLVKMRFFFLSVAASLVLAPAVQSGRIVDRQATAPFDCGQVRVDSPNTTYKGFVAADLDTERRYVVTKTDTQKRLLTSFENNTLFTLVSQAATQLQDNILTTCDIEQQRKESHFRRNLWILLGHATRQTKLCSFRPELRILQQRCCVKGWGQACRHCGVHQRSWHESFYGREEGPRERVGDILSRRCQWGDHFSMG